MVHGSMNYMRSKEQKITVYYDGLCRLCSREIDHYRGLEKSQAIHFVDITAPEFDAAQEGVDPVQVHKVMHVKRSDGSLALGVDAFQEIWAAIPRYKWVAHWAKKKPVRKGLDAFYNLFVKVRPFLPRKKAECSASPYCDYKLGEQSTSKGSLNRDL